MLGRAGRSAPVCAGGYVPWGASARGLARRISRSAAQVRLTPSIKMEFLFFLPQAGPPRCGFHLVSGVGGTPTHWGLAGVVGRRLDIDFSLCAGAVREVCRDGHVKGHWGAGFRVRRSGDRRHDRA